jgi:hypothetical protein
MDGGGQYNPRTVEEVFRDFKGRRAGMIKALTTGLALALRINSSFLSFLSFQSVRVFGCEFPHSADSCSLIFFFLGCGFVDVEEFYQQCDPG